MAKMRRDNKLELDLTRYEEGKPVGVVGQLVLNSVWLKVDKEGFAEGIKQHEAAELHKLTRGHNRDKNILRYQDFDVASRFQAANKEEKERRDAKEERRKQLLMDLEAEQEKERQNLAAKQKRARKQLVNKTLEKLMTKLIPSNVNTFGGGTRSSMSYSTRQSLVLYRPSPKGKGIGSSGSTPKKRPTTAGSQVTTRFLFLFGTP